jgi:TolB-like protein
MNIIYTDRPLDLTAAAREELERLLDDDNYRSPPRRKKMLRYIVEETLAGRSGKLNAVPIAQTVFGRGASFDHQSDPVVRIEAHRLRNDLASYYALFGQDTPLRISIPKGHYAARFAWADEALIDQPEMKETSEPGRRGEHRLIAAAILGGIVIVAILGIVAARDWWVGKKLADTSIQPPVIAVLPFEILSKKEEDGFLAIGITNHLVAELQRFPDIRIRYAQADTEQGSKPDLVAMGKRFGVSYLVAGSLQSDGSFVNVSARLIDVQSAEVIWSNMYKRSLDVGSILSIQGDISTDIAARLAQPYGEIRNAITERLHDRLPSMSSYECVLRGYLYRRSFLPALYGPAYDCLQETVRKDPDYSEAWAMLAWLYLDAVRFSHIKSPDPNITFDTAATAGLRAIALEPENVMGLKALSAIEHYRGNFSESQRLGRMALEINPDDPDSLIQLGWRLAFRGNFEEGVPLVERAIEKTVDPPGWYYHSLAIERLLKGDGEGMLSYAERASIDGSAISQSLVAMAYGLLKNRQSAELAVARMNEITPDYDPIGRFRNHQATDEILEAMTAALSIGWPDLDQSHLQRLTSGNGANSNTLAGK